ncbi:hypothetical protein J9884_20475 [Chromobacterium violaceum]|nr:hypothetical protein [Chromobacterium violaceum]
MEKHTHTFTGEGKFPNTFAQMIIRDTTVMLAGSAAGGLAAESVADAFDDELEEFSKWKIQ